MSERYTYPFTEEEFNQAVETWNANCGPSALAFAVQCGLDAVRPAIPDFEKRGYVSPTMMKAAIAALGRTYQNIKIICDLKEDPADNPAGRLSALLGSSISLVRAQWTGPWTKAGMNPKWAYWHTHWIAGWLRNGIAVIFDCNGGLRTLESWHREIVPLLAQGQRRDGGWYPTHIWNLEPALRANHKETQEN